MTMFVTGNLNLFDAQSAKELGYDSVKHYRDDFLEQWYEDVKSDDDQVYILGNISQFAPTTTLEFLDSLPGIKHLIVGPRDRLSPDTKRGWETAQEYYKVFTYVNTSTRRRIDGTNTILSYYGPDSDCWWAPRPTDAYYVTAWETIPEESNDNSTTIPWVTPNELSVSWGSWSRLVAWDEVKEMFADRQDMID